MAATTQVNFGKDHPSKPEYTGNDPKRPGSPIIDWQFMGDIGWLKRFSPSGLAASGY
jgi:hypothetical protein